MRSGIIAVILGAVLIGLLFWAASESSHPTPAQRVAMSAGQIGKGFVGARRIGYWGFVCTKTVEMSAPAKSQPATPPAASANAGNAAPSESSETEPANAPSGHATQSASRTTSAGRDRPAPKPVSLGRCRVMQEFFGRNRRPLLSFGFRLIGEKKMLSLIVRFPAVARPGQAVFLAIRGGALQVPVTACGPGGCAALAALSPVAQRALIASGPDGGMLVFPPTQRGQRPKMRVSLFGIEPALEALRRAES